MLAEQERKGGISQHTSPVAQVGDVGSLLLNAGFKIPTVDTDVFHINYDDAVEVRLTSAVHWHSRADPLFNAVVVISPGNGTLARHGRL